MLPTLADRSAHCPQSLENPISRDADDRHAPESEGRYFKPFDPDQPLLARCGCGKDHSLLEHQAELAAPSPGRDIERFSAEFIEATLVKAIFPHEPTRRSLIRAIGAGTLRAVVAAALAAQLTLMKGRS